MVVEGVMDKTTEAHRACKLLRVSRSEAVRTLDSLMAAGRDIEQQPVQSNADLAHARTQLADWTSTTEQRLLDMFLSCEAAAVYQRAADGLSATFSYTGGDSYDDRAARIRRAVDRRLDGLGLIRMWLDQCH
jgi:hypothetical protein